MYFFSEIRLRISAAFDFTGYCVCVVNSDIEYKLVTPTVILYWYRQGPAVYNTSLVSQNTCSSSTVRDQPRLLNRFVREPRDTSALSFTHPVQMVVYGVLRSCLNYILSLPCDAGRVRCPARRPTPMVFAHICSGLIPTRHDAHYLYRGHRGLQ